MSKITKQQLKQHDEVAQLLWGSDRPLKRDEVEFCLEHWDPRADSGRHVANNQAYFTPMTLARDAALYVGGNGRRVVDICAGTGRLAYAVLEANGWQPQEVQVTAVEFNPEFVRVGRRLLPEVDWILGDCYDPSLWQSLPRFDEAISNPPFGAVVTEHDTDWVGYRGPAGLTVAAIGLQVARLGIKMILPQAQTIFRYSGADGRYGVYADSYAGYLQKFIAQRPELEWDYSSLDTEAEAYKSEWRGVAPIVEVVSLHDPEATLLPLSPMPAISRPVYSLALTG
jgi:methylase of polypeptide subunit release factors